MISPRGCNAGGHRGWFTMKCRICARVLTVGEDLIYVCPKCEEKYEAYFCEADYRKLHGRCPYCNSELQLLV